MQRFDYTAPTAAENLAADEALVEHIGESDESSDILRLWEPATPLVVVGRASRVADEVHREACTARGIPILRRASGGCAVVAGPGCLMYSLVFSLSRHPQLRRVDAAHAFVLDRIVNQLAKQHPGIARAGTSDLALQTARGRLKFSGNSLRITRRALLYHGTILHGFDLALIDACLAMPPRQPGYRAGRHHSEFVTNLALPRDTICEALVAAFDAREAGPLPPRERIAELAADKYSRADWNLRH